MTILDPNANQFVNQGYNNINYPPSPRVVQQQPPQQSGTRIIPIQIEGANNYQTRSPQSGDQTVVMQRLVQLYQFS
jgi:hypothetical protein